MPEIIKKRRRRRRQIPAAGGRKFKTPQMSASAAKGRFKFKNRSTPIEILRRSSSEPSFSFFGDGEQQKGKFPMPEESDKLLSLPLIGSTVFASSPSLLGGSSHPSSPLNHENYKDAKVVINVSVEGSPGPIRIMIKLSSNVEETIKSIIDKYSEERRTPKLDKESAFELHHSPFSLQNLEKSEVLGEIGSRNFYLRKSPSRNSNSSNSSSPTLDVSVSTYPCHYEEKVLNPCCFLASITHKFLKKITRVLKLLVCMP